MKDEVLRAIVIALAGGAALAIAKSVAGFLRRAVMRDMRAMISEVVDEKIEPLSTRTEQLLPNGGSSLADAIRRIEKRLTAVEEEHRTEH